MGETNRCITESLIGGGKGINVSLMLAQLGVPTTALGFAAGFTGEELIRQLQDQSVNADFIRCAQGQTRINVKINSGVETEINGRGPEVSAAEREALLDRIRRIQPGDTLVLSGNVPPTLPESIYEQILAELPASSIRVVVDAEGALLRDTLRFHPFLIKPNNHELGEIFGTEIKTREEVPPYARKLQEMGACNVLVSMAGQGAVLAAADGSCHMAPAPKGRLVNAVGAGDSMVAGFIAGYLEKGIMHTL